MNKNTYRIIFNKIRSQWMVVPETAQSHCKSSGGAAPAESAAGAFRARISMLRFSLLLSFGLACFPAFGQIIADPTAPANQRPVVSNAANGTPVVNIQAPSAGGVSRNTYQQMDVNSGGAILNNATGNVQTQLGGWIQGNSLLGGNSARVILNEVNSSNPTYLHGFIEVAGQRAQVIVANPSGISCDGCGFINANRATLTTGTPVFTNGNLESFRVERGTVSITGAGLDASQTDYTSILARAVQVNAGIWANQLDIIAGANKVAFSADSAIDSSGITPLQTSDAAPMLAIDVAQLGGMYAGKIHLIGTETGVGVRNAGTVGASAGEVTITADGYITNSGTLRASTNLALTGENGLGNSGTAYADGSTRLSVAGEVTNTGLLASAGNVDITARTDSAGKAGTFTNADGATLAAGLSSSMQIGQSGNLSVSATGNVQGSGQLAAGDTQSWSGNRVSLANEALTTHDLNVTAQSADLSGVKLTTDGKVDIRAGNTLSTASASIQAGSLQLSGSTFNNVGGTLSQTGIDPFSLHFANSVDNSGGTLWTAGAADLASANFINAGGQLIAQGDVHVSATNLQNQQGALWSGRNADISAGNLDNTGGILQAVNALGISAGTLQNGKGSLLSGGAQTINVTGALDNTQGLILATNALNITATGQTITNTNGQIGSAAGNLNASFGTLDNQSGKLSARQAMQLADGNIKNAGGSIVATGLDINTQGRAIDNTDGTIASNAGLGMHSGALDNTRGTIQALGDASIDTEGAQLTNRASGENQGILSQGQLTLKTGVLDNTGGILRSWAGATLDAGSVSNDTGNILAQTSLALTANQYTGSGTLASYGDLSLTLQGGFTNVGHVQAAANLTLDVHGALSNQSALEAGQTLKVSATSIDNTAAGEFNAATTHLTTTGSLTNRGLIDGGLTWLEAAGITNLGSGRIYGDHVAVQTGSLTNGAEGGTSAVIAARQRMDIAAGSIDNGSHAMLFSGGDMNFGGSLDASQQATGQGGTLINHSATIESLGNMALNVGHVENLNDNFQTQVVEVSRKHVVFYNYNGHTYTPEDGATVDDNNGHPNLYLHGERQSTEFDRYIYDEVVTETQVVSSDPAIIRSGGNLSLQGQLRNVDSQLLAGGVFSGNVSGIDNQGTIGKHTTSIENGWYTAFRNNKNPTDHYDPPAVVEQIDLGVTVKQEQTSTGASGTSITARPDTGSPGSTGKQPTITEVSGTGTQTVRTSPPSITLPDNSLFHLNLPGTPASTGHYLVETDPRFANYKTWISSDAMLSALGYDPATTEKRLGDGFYEQKLIREQVSLLTGQRFLQGYASDEDQYKALMDNGVSFAKKYQLVPGVALSAEQMALLTSDIVWLVEQSVKLPDGSETKVLVPQVYARAQSGDIDGSGTLIAAHDVQIKLSGALANSGKLAARESLTVDADSISQNAGRMSAGSVDLTATKDITLTGGTLTGKQLVSLDAGRNVVIASQARSASNGNFSSTDITRTAGIEVGSEGQEAGQLIITARQDVTLAAATLVNHGTSEGTVIAAGNNLTLDTVRTSRDVNMASDGDHHIEADRSEVGTTIQTNGALQLQATAGNLNARAATISSGDALTIVAGNDISITAGEKSHAVDEEMHFSKKGFLSSASSGYHNQSSEASALGTSITSKGSMNVQADRDLTVSASTLSAQGDAVLYARRDLALQTQTYTQSSASSSYESKRGFSGGVTSAGYGSAKLQQTETSSTTEEVSASIAGKNVQLLSGQDMLLRGANVYADEDLQLYAGRNLTSEEARRKVQYEATATSSSSGISASLSHGNVAYSSSKINSGQTYDGNLVVGTNLAAGGNISIHAEGDALLRATSSAAGGEQTVSAKDVKLESANDEEHSRSWSEVSGRNMVLASDPTREAVRTARSLAPVVKSALSLRNQPGMELKSLSGKDVGGLVKGSVVPENKVGDNGQPKSGSTEESAGKVAGAVIKRADAQRQRIDAAVASALERQYSHKTSRTITDSYTETAHVTELSSGGDTLVSADNITSLGARITSKLGDVTLSAKDSINLDAATTHSTSETHTQERTATIPSNHVITGGSHSTIDSALGSELTGKNINISAGDVSSYGLFVNATEDINITATKKLDLLAAEQTVDEDSRSQDGTRGLYKSSRTSATLGSKQAVQDSERTTVTAQGATLAAGGNINLKAGTTLTLEGAQVASGKDINATAGTINIIAARGQDTLSQGTSSRDGGLSLTAKGGVIDAANQALDAAERYANADNSANAQHERRMGALQGILAAKSVNDSTSSLNGDVKDYKGCDGSTKCNEITSTGMAVELTIGNKRNTTETISDSRTLASSSLQAGGDINLRSTEGDITVAASKLDGQNINVSSAKDINLLGWAETNDLYERNSSHSGSFGVGVGRSSEGANGFYITASGSRSLGHGAGQGETYVETTIDAAKKLTLTSGQDINLTGALANGETIKVNAGRDLNLASQQDIDDYRSNDYSVRASGSVAIYGGGGGVSGSASFNHINSTYKSVTEQTGLYAGNGGYDIYVGKNTSLTGAVIASEADPTKNHFSTDTLTVADLDNKARYESYGASASFQFSSSGGNSAKASETGQGQNTESTQSSSTDASKSTTTYSRNYGVSLPQFGSTKGTTSSAIAEGSLEIRSGENVDVSRDTANANGSIGKIFDKGEVTRNAELSQTVGQVANMAIGEYAKSKTKNYELAQLDMQQALKASENASPEDAALLSQRIAHDQEILQQEQSTYDLWKDGGDAKIIAHAIAGAIQAQAGGGNILAGATSAGTTELSGTLVQDYLEKNYPDLSDTTRKSIQQWISTMTGVGIGALTAQASGGNVASAAGTGAVVSQDAERYNRLLHPKEIVRLQKLAPEFARQLSSETGRTVTEAEALILLSNAAYADVDSDAQKFSAAYLASWSANPTGAMDYIAAKKFIEEDSQKAGTWVDDAGVTQRYFVAKPGKTDFYNSSMYSQYTDSQAYRNFSYSVLGINFPPTSKTDTVGWSIYNKNEAERLKQGATTFAEGLAITAIAAITERAVGVGVNYVQIKKTTNYLNNGGANAMMSTVDGEAAAATVERQSIRALVEKVADLRAILPSGPKTKGNMGVAQIDIPGVQQVMAASSQIHVPTETQTANGFVGEVPEVFKSETVPSLSGALIDRATDSEAKILNNIAMKLGDNTEIKGSVNLFTERPPCSSCSNVINLFKDKYKNITVNVYDNNGKTIPPVKKGF